MRKKNINMNKKIILSALNIFLISCFMSCGDIDDDAPKQVLSGKYELTKGFVNLTDGIKADAPLHFDLILHNVFINATTDSDGKGEYLSIKLISNMENEKPFLPNGEYLFSSDAEKDKSILKDEASHFTLIRSHGNNKFAVTGGYITVDFSDGNYTISGVLESDSDKFEFNYFGALEITDNRSQHELPKIDVLFERADLHYYNKYIEDNYETSFYNHVITMENDEGEILSIEITNPVLKSGYYSKIAGGDYESGSINDLDANEKSLIINGDNSFFIFKSGEKFAVSWGLMSVIPDGKYTNYSLNGTIYLTKKGTVNFNFEGELPISKAFLNAKKGSINIQGSRFYNFDSYEIKCVFTSGVTHEHNGLLKGIGEDVTMNLLTPLNRYNQYLPISDGKYVAEERNFKPFHLITHQLLSLTGVTFSNIMGQGTLHKIKEGYVNVEGDPSDIYQYKITANFKTKVEYDNELLFTEPDGKEMEIVFEYENKMNLEESRWGEWWRHPTSTLTDNISPNFSIGAMDWLYSDYWEVRSGGKKNTYVEIYLATDLVDGKWNEWFGYDGLLSNKYLIIGLMMPESADNTPFLIPDGTYTFDDLNTFDANTYLRGFRPNFENEYRGSFYFSGDNTEEAPIGYGKGDGYVKVKREGEIYTLEFMLYDDQVLEKTKTISGTYTGKLPDKNEFPLTEAAKKSINLQSGKLNSKMGSKTTVRSPYLH